MICDKCGCYSKDGMPGCLNCMAGGGIRSGYPKTNKSEPYARVETIEEIIKDAQKQLMKAKIEAFVNINARGAGDRILVVEAFLQHLVDHVFTLKIVLQD